MCTVAGHTIVKASNWLNVKSPLKLTENIAYNHNVTQLQEMNGTTEYYVK